MAGHEADRSEAQHLLELWEHRICPWCKKSIPEGAVVGSGRPREGGFCRLDCYTRYYELELAARAHRAEAALRGTS